jgi:hypothetical protein
MAGGQSSRPRSDLGKESSGNAGGGEWVQDGAA